MVEDERNIADALEYQLVRDGFAVKRAKPFSTRELIARIHAILRRPRAAGGDAPASHGGGISLDPGTREVTVRGRAVPMPRKEFELLEYMMARPNRVLRRETLLEDVWGFDFGGDSRTLDVHVKRLRAKCEDDPASPKRLVTVRGVGYKFVP